MIFSNIYAVKALYKICQYQKTINLIVLKALFQRLVREMMQMMISVKNDNFHIQFTVFKVLQKVSEVYIIFFLKSENIYSCDHSEVLIE